MFILTKILPLFLYPVGLCIVLCTTGIAALVLNRKRVALFMIISGVGVLGVCALPVTSNWAVRSLESRYAPVPAGDMTKASAIVVLGGGELPPAPPRLYAEVTEGGDRILHGARLFHAERAPWVVTTGGEYPSANWEGTFAEVSADLLAGDLGVPRAAILLEEKSRNTYEHVAGVRALLEGRKAPLEIILVTSALHMHRSVKVFEGQGFTVHPAVTDFLVEADFTLGVFSFLPESGSLSRSTAVLHEYFGLVAYRLLGRF